MRTDAIRVLGLALACVLMVSGRSALAAPILSIDEAQLIADGEAPDGELYRLAVDNSGMPEFEFDYLIRSSGIIREVLIDGDTGSVNGVSDRTPSTFELARITAMLDAVPSGPISFQQASDIALGAFGRGEVIEIEYEVENGDSITKVVAADGLELLIAYLLSLDGTIIMIDDGSPGGDPIDFVDAVVLAQAAVSGGGAVEGKLVFDDSEGVDVYKISVLDPAIMLARVLTYSQLTGELFENEIDNDPIDDFMRIYDFVSSANFGLAASAAISEAACPEHPTVKGKLEIVDGHLLAEFEQADGLDRPVIVIDTESGDVLRNDCAEPCDDCDCDQPGLNPGLVRAIEAAERHCPDGQVLFAEFKTGNPRAWYDLELAVSDPSVMKLLTIKPGSEGRLLGQSEREITPEEAIKVDAIVDRLGDAVLSYEDALRRARELYCHGQPRSVGFDLVEDRLVYRVGIKQGHRTVVVLVDAITGQGMVIDAMLRARTRVSPDAPGRDDLNLGSRGGKNGLTATYRSDRGNLVYLEYDPIDGRWYATILNDRGELITEEAESDAFEDRKSGKRYITVITNAGLILINPQEDASKDRNITDELPGSTPIVEKQTTLITIDGLVVVAGLDAAGDLVAYFQTREVRADGREVWSYVNLSRDHLAEQGLTTPAFADDLVGYVTPWNGLNIAGLDANGDIWSVWWAPGMALWSVSNLSELTDAAPMVGSLTVYVTPWGGINLAGLDANGEVVVTWWVPEFNGNWAKNNLSREFGHRGFGGGEMTSYVTPWGGTNLAGIDDEGNLIVYWWAPGMDKWIVSPLSSLVQGAILPKGKITASTTDDGLINLLGFSAEGDLIRYYWRPGAQWKVEDVSNELEPMR